MFVYVLKSAICIAVYYLFFRLFLSRDTFYRFNRWALLSLLWLSLLLPLVGIGGTNESLNTMVRGDKMMADFAIGVATAEVLPDEGMSLSHLLLAWAMLIYLGGIVVFGLKTVFSYVSLFKMLHQGECHRLSEFGYPDGHDIRVLVHHNPISPFSWMHYIVLAEKDLSDNQAIIITHELGHIRHHHTIDLIFTEICLVFQWFNPAIWLLRRELQAIHEYQADENVLDQHIDAHQYQLLLIEKATGCRLQSITCSLHQSSIKNRITMMLKKKSNPWARAKVLVAIPVAAISVAVFATPEASALAAEVADCKVSELFTPTEVSDCKVSENLASAQDPEPKSESVELKSRIVLSLDGTPYLVGLNGSTQKMSLDDLQKYYAQHGHLNITAPSELAMKNLMKFQDMCRENGMTRLSLAKQGGEEHAVESVLEQTPAAKSETKTRQSQTAGNEVFTVCEKQPVFPGGESALMQFMMKNLRYPAESAKNNSQGRVTLSFVVEKDGSISTIEVMRAPKDTLLVQEAIRVISAMPKWEPGMQRGQNVRVKFVLPVTFRLRPEGESKADKKILLNVVDGRIIENSDDLPAPSQIESVQILKDEKAIEKYGQRGVNGVVEITTKK